MTQSFEYKSYTLVQELDVNFHYMIFDSEGGLRLHACCTKKIKSQKEAEGIIETMLQFCGNGAIEKIWGDDDE